MKSIAIVLTLLAICLYHVGSFGQSPEVVEVKTSSPSDSKATYVAGAEGKDSAAFGETGCTAWEKVETFKAKAKKDGYLAIAAAIAIGIAAIGGALGQGKVASHALEGIARNPEAAPKMFTPLMISLALIETLVIYALTISILIVLKIKV
jgi:ATP synthase F0 subunit c